MGPSILSSLRRVVLIAAIGLAVAPRAVAQARPLKVCVVEVTSNTGRTSVKKLRATLEQALEGTQRFEVVPLQRYSDVAKQKKISRRQWLDDAAMAQVAPELGLDLVLVGRLFRLQQGASLVLLGIEPTKGERIAKATLKLPRPFVNEAQAEDVAARLLDKIDATGRFTEQATAEPEPTEPEPTETGGSSEEPSEGGQSEWGGDDEWGSEEGFADIESAFKAAKLNVETGGRVALEHFTYFEDLGEDKVGGRDSVDVALKAKASTKRLLAEGTMLVRYDIVDPSRNRFDAEEAFVQYEDGPLTVRAGRSVVTWGTTNLFNPTDILNPVDMRDPVDTEKLGTWMVRAKLVLGPVLLDAYYLPVPEANLLPFYDALDEDGVPTSRSRWLVEDPDLEAHDNVRYTLAGDKLPNVSLAHSQGALRLATSALGADFTLGYATLYDRLPTLRVKIEPAPPNADVTIEFTHERLHLVTADFERAFGKLRLAAEGMAVLTEDWDASDDDVSNPYAIVAAGVDYQTSEFFGEHRVHLFLDLMTTQVLVGKVSDTPTDQMRFALDYGAFARMRYEWGPRLRFDLNVLSALDEFDMVINPEVQYDLHDSAMAKLGLVLLIGDKDHGFFSQYFENSRLVAGVEVEF